ncbi:hypothetical protein BDN70DRAFT_881580 [Pholiota conissans]|uniref:C2H2-type domain-containing protein n=1 Tax=Pholiota conissans TaxID=109636 RepID=A0A9P5YYY8_9AGAR|nr:hypothetical protein BDN70DRAFT_881580 [Pholiota conissans]
MAITHLCRTCSKTFTTPNGLKCHAGAKHPNSPVKKGRNFKCPFCQRMFKSPSGIAQHIESGYHKVTRHQVTAAVHNMRIIPNISVKRITGPVQPSTTRTTYIATAASLHGNKYKCSLCKREFNTLGGLNSHLNSAAHDDKEFRCPKCKREFTLVSGFVQHLECQACGLTKPAEINGYFRNLTGRFSRLLTM